MFILITYNFKNPEVDYSDFFKIIEDYQEHIQVMNNVWIVHCEDKVTDLSKRLQSTINVKDDSLLLLEISPDLSISGWMPSSVVSWIKNIYLKAKNDKKNCTCTIEK